MPLKSCERLFLLEFMVHEVFYIDTGVMNQDFLTTLGPTIVEFTSEDFPYIDISEDEFGVMGPYESTRVKFRSGKSCLFALRNSHEKEVGNKVQIIVSRKLPSGGYSSSYKFGTAYLKLSSDFVKVLYSSGTNPESQSMKVSLDLFNNLYEQTGTISILLRLTCFGMVIYTQFHMSSVDKRSFSFKGDKLLPLNPLMHGNEEYSQDHTFLPPWSTLEGGKGEATTPNSWNGNQGYTQYNNTRGELLLNQEEAKSGNILDTIKSPRTRYGEFKTRPHNPAIQYQSGPQSPDIQYQSGPQSPSNRYQSGPQSPSNRYQSGPQSPSNRYQSGPQSPSNRYQSGPQSLAIQYQSGPQNTIIPYQNEARSFPYNDMRYENMFQPIDQALEVFKKSFNELLYKGKVETAPGTLEKSQAPMFFQPGFVNPFNGGNSMYNPQDVEYRNQRQNDLLKQWYHAPHMK